ncbi:MAG TPA: MFS transporter [Candidatus Udaeobacter sp.]|nr:MFS transporter [Candidatus Udaeobacter sp.]
MKPIFSKIVDVKPNEIHALWLSFIFNFLVLGSYYVIKPVRDDIGAHNGVENLWWMFTGTLLVALVANTAFSAIVARMSRRRFIPIAYRFFILNLAIFYVAMRYLSNAAQFWVGTAFFIWVSGAFNLFILTVFWAFMSDLFSPGQGKRLFAFISVGGELGGIVGAFLAGALVRRIGAVNLLIISAVMLEAAAWCVRFFPAGFQSGQPEQSPVRDDKAAERPIGGGIITGISHVFRSPYLMAICGFMFLYAITTTFVYFQQADITGSQFHDRAARTAFFAHIDTWVNSLTLLVQLFLTGRLLKWIGVGPTLAFLPVLSMIGFIAIGISPVLSLFAVFQVARRAGNFAVTRPAREVLFTVLSREDKYKAKSFIDTFVYRVADQVGAWSYSLLRWLGLGLTGISWIAVPLTGVWCILSIFLGRKQRVLADAQADRDRSSPLTDIGAPEPA